MPAARLVSREIVFLGIGLSALLLHLFCLAAVLPDGAQPARPAPEIPVPTTVLRFRLEPSASHIRFTLGATLHTVHGTARLRRGEVVLERSGALSGEILVDARSLETGNARRDLTMHTKVLESERHTEILLRVTGLAGTIPRRGDSEVTLEGDLVLRGSPHPVRIPLYLSVEDHRLTASGTFTVPYVEWGLRDPSVFVLRVAKEVRITLTVAGTLSTPSPPAGP